MPLWKMIVLAFAAVTLLSLGLMPSQEERLPQAKLMAETSAEWFAKEEDLGTFSAQLKADRIAVVGTSESYALVTTKGGEKYYLRIASPPGVFSQILADQIADKQIKVVSLGNIGPPSNFIAKHLNAKTMFVLMQLVPIALIAFMLLTMTNVIDFSGGFNFEKPPKVKFADVIGCAEAKSALRDICAYLRNPDSFVALGATAPKGVLMVGPPGTGKTLLARSLAGECGVPVMVLDGSSFSDKFMGVGVQRVRKLFKQARKHAPCVIFIDEIDGIGRRGGADGGPASQENSRVVNALLTSLDGFSKNEGVIVIGATNHRDLVDPALVRDGRFDRSCHLSLPNIDEREQLFVLYAARLVLDASDEVARTQLFRQLARMSAGLSPASIANVVNTAAVMAVNDRASTVRLHHFTQALEQKRLGTPTDGIAQAMTASERERVAVHEAGHAIIARLRHLGAVEKVTIVPRSQALGVTLVTSDDEQFMQTESELNARLEMLLGGRCAEILLLNEASTGAADDLKRASEMALRMGTEFGFSTEAGPFSFAAFPNHDAFPGMQKRVLEAEALLKEAESRCARILRAHRGALQQLSNALLDHETVDASVVEACLADHPPAPEDGMRELLGGPKAPTSLTVERARRQRPVASSPGTGVVSA